jgi:hypothetical protein
MASALLCFEQTTVPKFRSVQLARQILKSLLELFLLRSGVCAFQKRGNALTAALGLSHSLPHAFGIRFRSGFDVGGRDKRLTEVDIGVYQREPLGPRLFTQLLRRLHRFIRSSCVERKNVPRSLGALRLGSTLVERVPIMQHKDIMLHKNRRAPRAGCH